eukprot:XP_011433362.2 PREDICTED: uncharacterized protein LOC105332451 [Crassostrea gigas]
MKPVIAIPLIVGIALGILGRNGNGASVSIPDESIKEICDGDTICDDIKLEANTSQIIEVILPQQQSNNFLQCSISPNEEPKCAPDSSVSFKYKRETQILQFCMKFNQTKHSENKMVVKRNEEIYLRILLLPCKDDFKASAVHNKTHVTVTCKHDAFKFSNSGIKIERENNIVAQCVWSGQCIGAEAVASGIQLITEYDPKIKYSCAMDGQSVQINNTEQDDDFKASAVHNKTHVTVTCEHDAFKFSNSGIKIESENDIVAQCVWSGQCIGPEAVASGIQLITEYDPKIIYSCVMDGQSVQINYTEQ